MGDSDRDRGRERDLVLAPNEYAFISDETKGNINVYVGPHKTSLANTDRPVIFNPENKRFERCSLEQAILASTAIPGVFEPVAIGGELFVDGCVTASVDLATAAEMGATEILAIDLTPLPAPARPKTAAGVLKQSFSILTSATTRAAETCLARQMPVRVIRPDLSHNSPWRLDDSAGSIARNLRLAADGLRGVFDSDGHIAPDGTCWAMPPAALPAQEGVSPSRFFGAARKAS